MKIAGRKIEGPNVETIIIPRGDGPPIVFIAEAVLDDEPFNKLCPLPKPPAITKPGNMVVYNIEDPAYKKQLQAYAEKKTAWLVIASLRATPNLEWEIVRYDDSETWLKVYEELKQAGFSVSEINRIVNGIMSANCLNEAKLAQARETFFRSQQVTSDSFSQKVEQAITQSGELASA